MMMEPRTYARPQRRALGRAGGVAVAAILAVAFAGCKDDEDGGARGEGACEVSGGIIRATCYQGWDDCGTSSSHTLHEGKQCDAVGYARPCCDSHGQEAAAAKYWRPTGGSCDSGDVVCGTAAPAQDKCKQCLSACRGDPLCCTGNGCYCESECG